MATFDRFLEVHLTADTGFYGFAHDIQTQGDYLINKTERLGKKFLNLCDPPFSVRGGYISKKPYSQLPDTGVIAVPLCLGHLHKKRQYYRSLIEWVSDTAHTGKVRFNAHGRSLGVLCMETRLYGTSYDEQPASTIPDFLWNHGMTTSKINNEGRNYGLSTITLNCCHGAAGEDGLSGVDMVIQGLKKHGLHGVKVTGSCALVSTARQDKEYRQKHFDRVWEAFCKRSTGSFLGLRQEVINYLRGAYGFREDDKLELIRTAQTITTQAYLKEFVRNLEVLSMEILDSLEQALNETKNSKQALISGDDVSWGFRQTYLNKRPKTKSVAPGMITSRVSSSRWGAIYAKFSEVKIVKTS